MDSGKLLVYAGLALLAVGLAVSYAPWLFSWFGRLPGDIRIEEETRRIFFPITSMLLISALLSLLLNLLFRR